MAAPLFWAGNWVVARVMVQRWHPVEITFLRWAIGAGALVGLALWREGRLPRLDRRGLLAVAGCGLVGLVGYTLLQYEALRYTQAINGSLIFTATPAFTLLLARLVLGEVAGPVRLAGVGLTLAGVALVLTGGSWQRLAALQVNPGDALVLLADGMWAAYTVASRRVGLSLSPVVFSAYNMLAALGWLFPVQVWLWAAGRGAVAAGRVVWQDWAALAYVGLFASAAAYVGWSEGVRQVGAGPASVFGNLLPVFTAVLATATLGETFGWAHLAGAVLVMAGVWACGRPVPAGRSGKA
ncbi:MAG TPA: DMT family transporter [Limnochordales bacterium]